MTERQEARKYAGLPGVAVVTTVRHCPDCGEEELAYPNIEGLNRAITHDIAHKRSPLLPPEIRFLRTYLGLASKDLAKTIGVRDETVSRWENGRVQMERPTELLLRILALTRKPVSSYPPEPAPEPEALADLAQGDPVPLKRKAVRNGANWELAAVG
jgi:putative zinc finger/helix-turn-helix YgiT family protein